MATVGVTLSARGARDVPVLKTDPRISEAFTSSGTSQPSTGAATQYEYWRIAVSGGAVWVAFGSAPVAAAGDHYLLPDGAVETFEATEGDKVAIIDA